MGGTFDPIHIAHLSIAEEIRERFNFNRVIFVPAGNPPHKDCSRITSSKHRYLMTVLATYTNPYFEVSSFEVEKEETTYTIDTVKAFKELYKDETEIYFVIGADTILELITWKDIDKLFKLCSFIGVPRPNIRLDKIKKEINKLNHKFKSRIYLSPVSQLQISSTDIRRRVKENKSIKYLLPESVENYIYKNKLYIKQNNLNG
ncbi:nicotinate (nicotinamide) nucleotide adenylyltransferase [Thermohalobacter berrensis]|uniref:Probable nicotinate-nucleotide adenylyltransferase n=2 Tax=Thermohalobacter berrensis TaxID=99594 RepID=A0A419T531_9FIRM|nr:nicotinate (nicotinamide) nucleotide adenylyltransferase [Thermohalobacter berrensis]